MKFTLKTVTCSIWAEISSGQTYSADLCNYEVCVSYFTKWPNVAISRRLGAFFKGPEADSLNKKVMALQRQVMKASVQ